MANEGYRAVNIRVPTSLRNRVDRYLNYMKDPESERPKETVDWPDSLTGVVVQALEDFLATHPQQAKRGTKKKRSADIKPKSPQHDPFTGTE